MSIQTPVLKITCLKPFLFIVVLVNRFFQSVTHVGNSEDSNDNDDILNNDLIRDLDILNMWSPEVKNNIVKNHGSIQNIEGIPQVLKNLFRTVWEIPQPLKKVMSK